MKKKLIVISVLGAMAGFAQAQSHVQIYGTVDTGYVKENGSDWRMDSNNTSLIGFRGFEDLGNGLKATFELEKQFTLNDGQSVETYNSDHLRKQDSADWAGAANVGFEGDFGKVRLGRIAEISYDYFYTIDPFEQGSTGSSLALYNRTHSEQLSNTIRYDSPEWNGLGVSASFSTKGNSKMTPKNEDNTNYGFAGSIHYDNGPLVLMANYNRLADSNKSWVYNLGAGYQFGPARITVGYQQSQYKKIKTGFTDYYDDTSEFDPMQQKEWMIGLTYDIGPGTFKLAYNRASIDDWKSVTGEKMKDGDVNKYAMGYTYELSKRTSLYGIISYTDSDNKYVGSVYNNNSAERESVTGFQVGMTHNF